MKTGDIVKGLPSSDNKYLITNSRMTKGVVVDVDGECIEVRIIAHEDSSKIGSVHRVEEKYFEKIGELKTFDREKVFELLKGGDFESFGEYNLSRADLRGADLSRADLSRADLRGADLSGADLSGANLRGADLSGANLSRADLRGADLSGANLRGADLRGADLSRANLSRADLSRADLSRADLSRANLSGANLSGANLSRANLSGADLREANLDFSCLPLWCGSLLANMDDRQVKQLLYHTLSIVKHSDNVSETLKKTLLTKKNIEAAKEFHRADECRRL